jgi:hypothetical protein
MSVAPSFQNFEFLCEPYEVNGKMYIRVRNPKTGTERQVRWYDEKKTAAAPIPKVNAQDAFYKPQKEVLGFTHGYITIFKGDTYAKIDWFRASIARYARWWGWYIISTEELPEDLPDGITPVRLPWELVGDDNGKLKPESDVQKAVEALIYDEGTSEYVGEIGERLELTLTVTRAIELESNYGYSMMHIMEDECGNVFMWTTASKRWSEGSVKHFRGTVKEHRLYKNTKQTVLTRCAEL